MKTVIAANGDTWDSIAYKYLGDEFQCDLVMEANARHYSDVLVFDGGERLQIPDEIVSVSNIIKAPWED